MPDRSPEEHWGEGLNNPPMGGSLLTLMASLEAMSRVRLLSAWVTVRDRSELTAPKYSLSPPQLTLTVHEPAEEDISAGDRVCENTLGVGIGETRHFRSGRRHQGHVGLGSGRQSDRLTFIIGDLSADAQRELPRTISLIES